jgi:hypothetical protein
LKELALGFGRKAACEARKRPKETPQTARNVAAAKQSAEKLILGTKTQIL